MVGGVLAWEREEVARGDGKLQMQEGGRRRCGIPPDQPRARDQGKDAGKPSCNAFSARLNDAAKDLFSGTVSVLCCFSLES